jgi:hypothetical protein
MTVETLAAYSAAQLQSRWNDRNGRYLRLRYSLDERAVQAAIDWRRAEAEALPPGIERVRALALLASWRPITNLSRR